LCHLPAPLQAYIICCLATVGQSNTTLLFTNLALCNVDPRV